ncbi:MAG: hypothetical protein QXW98_05330 [Candidatus Caldarchaeum sp.]
MAIGVGLQQLAEGLRRFFENYMAEERAARELLARLFLLQQQQKAQRELLGEKEKARREALEESLQRIRNLGADLGLNLGLGPSKKTEALSNLLELAFLKAAKPPEITRFIEPSAYSPGGLMSWGGFTPFTPLVQHARPGEALINLGLPTPALGTGEVTRPAGAATKIVPQGGIAIEEGTGRLLATAPQRAQEEAFSIFNVGNQPFLINRRTGEMRVPTASSEVMQALKKAIRGTKEKTTDKIRAAQIALKMLGSEYIERDPTEAARRQLLGIKSDMPPIDWLNTPEGKAAAERVVGAVSSLTGVPLTVNDLRSAASGAGYEWVYRGGKLEYLPAGEEEDEED